MATPSKTLNILNLSNLNVLQDGYINCYFLQGAKSSILKLRPLLFNPFPNEPLEGTFEKSLN